MFHVATMLHPPTMAKSKVFTSLTNLFNMMILWITVRLAARPSLPPPRPVVGHSDIRSLSLATAQ